MGDKEVSEVKKGIEEWLATKRDHAHIRLKSIDSDSLKANLSIGSGSATFELFIPSDYPKTDDPLSVYAEDEELSEWNMSMLEYCESSHKLHDLLNTAVKFYNSTKKGQKKKSNANEEEHDELELSLVDTHTKDTNKSNNNKKEKVTADKFFTGSGSNVATNRIIQDLNAIYNSHPEKFGYSAEPLNDNLYLWEVRLFGFEDGPLKTDLKTLKGKSGIDYVSLEMKFPATYPFDPPFIRVLKPRFQFHTGHVTIGGSICMELLTRSGWSPGNDIESILIQIRSEMISGGARLDFQNTREYTEEEAKQAFERVAKQHGWN